MIKKTLSIIGMLCALYSPVYGQSNQIENSEPNTPINCHYEKDIVLDISLRASEILQEQGHKVHLTRDGDYFITLENRVEQTKKINPDVFVSVHANWYTKDSASGFEVFSGKGADSSLADIILSKIDEANELRNRGSKKADFFVINPKRMKGINSALVELGFLSNNGDYSYLAKSKNRQDMAEAIASAIHDYDPESSVVLDPGHGGNLRKLYSPEGEELMDISDCRFREDILLCSKDKYNVKKKKGEWIITDRKGNEYFIGNSHGIRERFVTEWSVVDSDGEGVKLTDKETIEKIQKLSQEYDYAEELSFTEYVKLAADVYKAIYPELAKRSVLMEDFVRYQVARIKACTSDENGGIDCSRTYINPFGVDACSIDKELLGKYSSVNEDSPVYGILLEALQVHSSEGKEVFDALFNGRTSGYEIDGNFWKQRLLIFRFAESDGDSFGAFYSLLGQKYIQEDTFFALKLKDIASSKEVKDSVQYALNSKL
jgi:hypothetical protein